MGSAWRRVLVGAVIGAAFVGCGTDQPPAAKHDGPATPTLLSASPIATSTPASTPTTDVVTTTGVTTSQRLDEVSTTSASTDDAPPSRADTSVAGWPYLPSSEIRSGDEEPLFPPAGIAAEFVQPITSSQRFEPLDGMVIEGCRWRAPGYISVDANWLGDEVDGLPIGLVLWRGDQGFGGGGLVTLSGPGQFSVTFDFNGVPLWTGEVDNIENELGGIEIGRNGFTRYAGDECSLEQLPPVSVPLTWDLAPRSVTAVEGSAEWLAQSLDVRDADVGLLPFAYFMAYRGWNGFDRIHVAPNLYMTSMNVDFRPFAAIVAFRDTIEGDSDPFQVFGRCAEIRSDYDVDGETVNVYELFGCEPLSRWVDDPATIQADEPGDLRGLQVDTAPGEFVAVVGTSAAVEVVANDLIRAPITSAAP